MSETTVEANEAVEVRLSREVYFAALKVFEQMEREQRIIGNGHHAAQKVAALAVDELKSRWAG